jgi:uncharacterized membrane protein (DUF106 family)
LLNLLSLLAEKALAPVQGWHPLASLSLISVLVGAGMLWVFGRFSNQAAIRRAKARLQAHLYELRLFADEPSLIWRAQKGLLAWNARYLGLMLKPAIVLTIPMIPLLVQLDAFYGHAPLAVGEPAIVAVTMKDAPPPGLQAPPGIRVETPAVRVPRENLVLWRIRPQQATAGALRFVLGESTVEKTVVSGMGLRYLSPARAGSLAALFWSPREKLLPPGPVEKIEVRYPSAEIRWGPVNLHWLVWFLVISMAAALLLKGRLGVTI